MKLLNYLQQWLYTLVKEKFLSMLGNWISPIEQTLVIIQVVSQLLPRVTPEKTCIEVSHCYRGHKTTGLSYMDGPSTGSYDTCVIGLILQSTLVDW